MKYFSMYLIMLTLVIANFGSISAQDDATCTPKEVVSSFAIAVAEENVDSWLEDYKKSECPDNIKAGAEKLVEAFDGINVSIEESCQPEDPIVCNLFSSEAYDQLVPGAESFVFVSPSEAELQDRFSADCAHSGPYGLEITYLATGDGYSGWGVLWEKSPAGMLDASTFTDLTFWVRGDEGGEIFQVGLHDQNLEQKLESKQVTVVEDTWTKVTIPLARDFDKIKTDQIVNLNFGFNRDHREGTICIDDVAFE